MRYAVDAWAPDYGASLDDAFLEPSDATIDLAYETPADRWRPVTPEPSDPACLLFVDGVQRIDARVWITGDDGGTRLGVCATFAAGVTRCDGAASIEGTEVRRGLFTAAADAQPIETRHGTYHVLAAAGESGEQLGLAVSQRMSELERQVAERAGDADLLVIDGPLRGRGHLADAVGYIKSHRVGYLPPELHTIVEQLAPGDRTPLFLMTTDWSRFSWYLRLPGGGDSHAWSGVVRCEASADLPRDEVIARANRAAAWLPRFASSRHKDPRAPQNLYPIAGLERELRRRCGDATLLYRSLLASANNVTA